MCLCWFIAAHRIHCPHRSTAQAWDFLRQLKPNDDIYILKVLETGTGTVYLSEAAKIYSSPFNGLQPAEWFHAAVAVCFAGCHS